MTVADSKIFLTLTHTSSATTVTDRRYNPHLHTSPATTVIDRRYNLLFLFPTFRP